MANAVVSRVGQVNGAGGTTALFLTKYAGEVYAAFRKRTKFLDRHLVRTVSGTNAAQFPRFGTGGSAYHTPGTEIVGTVVKHNAVTIAVDDLLIADRFIAKIDEAMNHYDVRQLYSGDAGKTLAEKFDSNVAQVSILAARAAAIISGETGGTSLVDADADTNMASLVASIFAAQQKLDENNVPEDERYCYLRPAIYTKLVQQVDTAILDKDYNPENGSVAQGEILRIAGFELVKTNSYPTTNVATGPAAYQGDFTQSVALCTHKSAVATVKLMDLALEMGWDMRRQGTLILAKYAMGHGIIRPEAAFEIKKA